MSPTSFNKKMLKTFEAAIKKRLNVYVQRGYSKAKAYKRVMNKF
jgi:hypothetical protein